MRVCVCVRACVQDGKGKREEKEGGEGRKMRFALFGDRDCPDWLLGAVPTLSRLSCIRAALLALYILREAAAEASSRAAAIGESRDEMMRKMAVLLEHKVESEAEFELVVAALRRLLLSAVQHGVNGVQFEDECMQLGLPRDTSAALRRRLAHAQEHEHIADALRDGCVKLAPMSLQSWRVDASLPMSTSSSARNDGNTNAAATTTDNNTGDVSAILTFDGGALHDDIVVSADRETVDLLLFELRRAAASM